MSFAAPRPMAHPNHPSRHGPQMWTPRAALIAMIAVASTNSAATGKPAPKEFNCLIEPAKTVEIRSPVVGLVQEVHTKRGDTIRRGQLLVTLESTVEASAADAARARAQAEGALQLAAAKADAARTKAKRMAELFDEEFVSAQAKDDAANDARLSEAELKVAQENAGIAHLEHRQALDLLERRRLRSPFDGVVVDQYLHPGALVDSGDGRKPILKVAQTHPLLAQAILPYQLFAEVRQGAAVVVLPEPPFEREIAARIRTVDRVVDAAAGTFGVVVELPNPRQELPGGIRCRLRLVPPSR